MPRLCAILVLLGLVAAGPASARLRPPALADGALMLDRPRPPERLLGGDGATTGCQSSPPMICMTGSGQRSSTRGRPF